MKKILLVEDDPEIAELLNLHFNSSLYNLTSSVKGKDALEKISTGNYDLIILDIQLPESNGLEICKKLRENDTQTPVMMLTSRSYESDKVLALELGADDYITKPFGILELLARIKALLRRGEMHLINNEQQTNEIIYKDLYIDKNKKKASIKGKRLELTAKEFDLLVLLADNPGKSFTREELLKTVWGLAFAGYEHTVTAHINRLRIKIETNLNHPEYVLTSWGTGYRFTE
ncbi:MAG: response regulator transcription factor [Chitinophagaceae bacterium]